MPVYTRCIHGEVILASEARRKMDMAACRRCWKRRKWIYMCNSIGGRRMICEDECGNCTVCLGLYDDDYLEEEE